mgnify:CR=1 FL=1
MDNFIKPRKEIVDVSGYISKISILEKDLNENEEICEHCCGTGVKIENNVYGLSNDPDKCIGLFPYKHQSISFCDHCFNGIVKKCKYCGDLLPKGYLRHNCEQQMAINEQRSRNLKMLEGAKEFPPESISDFVMCYYDGYPYDNGYFMDWDNFFDWWYDDCEGEIPRPEYVWGTDVVKFTIDAYCVISNALEDYSDPDSISIDRDFDVDKLQTIIDCWIKEQNVPDVYCQSTKYKVKIPW